MVRMIVDRKYEYNVPRVEGKRMELTVLYTGKSEKGKNIEPCQGWCHGGGLGYPNQQAYIFEDNAFVLNFKLWPP